MSAEGGKDRGETNHQLDLLIRPGIANTVQVVREYLFTIDNIINGVSTYGMNSNGTKTMTALPSNTCMVLLQIEFYKANAIASLVFKRNSGAANTFTLAAGYDNLFGEFSRCYGVWWLPTDGNTIHMTLDCTVGVLNIIGYKVQGD